MVTIMAMTKKRIKIPFYPKWLKSNLDPNLLDLHISSPASDKWSFLGAVPV